MVFFLPPFQKQWRIKISLGRIAMWKVKRMVFMNMSKIFWYDLIPKSDVIDLHMLYFPSHQVIELIELSYQYIYVQELVIYIANA